VLEAQNISSLPIVDDTGKVIDTYHKSDVSFVIKAADTDEMIANLGSFRVEECIHLREQLLHSGEVMSAFQGLVVCRPDYPLSQIVRAMLIARSTKAVVVDEAHRCIGIVSVKDICRYYLSDGR
jgi:CBS domain-containing protein